MPIDFPQLVLTVTIVIITALLTVLGIEVFYILKDVRKMMDRMASMLSDAEQVVQNVKKPTEMIASVSQSAELLTKMFEMVKNRDDQKEKAPQHRYLDEVVEERPVIRQDLPTSTAQDMPQSMTTGRRFFRLPRRSAS